MHVCLSLLTSNTEVIFDLFCTSTHLSNYVDSNLQHSFHFKQQLLALGVCMRLSGNGFPLNSNRNSCYRKNVKLAVTIVMLSSSYRNV